MILSFDHLREKYGSREYSYARVLKGSSACRAFVDWQSLQVLRKEQLVPYEIGRPWDRSNPMSEHPFLAKATARFVGHFPHLRPPSPFIVGAARSGSTLLRLMLDRHSLMAIPPETHLPFKKFEQISLDANQGKAQFCQVISAHPWIRDFGIDFERFEHELNLIEPFTIADGLRLLYFMYAKKHGKPRWGDKTPPHCMNMRKISQLMPEVHFIHIVRDGRDVAVSMKNLWWGPGRDIEKQALRWKERIEHSREQAKSIPHYLELKYENLVTEPEACLKRICAYLRLPYEPTMLDFHQTAKLRLAEFQDKVVSSRKEDRTVTQRQIQDIHRLTASPLDSSRIGRWHRELSKQEIVVFERVAGDLLASLGYPKG
jgi:hypothetical protein